MRRIPALLLLAASAITASAGEVYRWTAPDGSVHYSDQPQTGAETIKMPEWAPPAPRHEFLPQSSPGQAGTSAFTVYNTLVILAPKTGDNVHDNQGIVPVTLQLEPALNTAENHRIRLLLDGEPHGEPGNALEQSLQGVERGRHTVAAQVINDRGRVLITSRPVTIYLKHASPLFHPPRPDTPERGVQQAPRAPMAPRAPRAPHAPFQPAPQTAPAPPPPAPSPPPASSGLP